MLAIASTTMSTNTTCTTSMNTPRAPWPDAIRTLIATSS